MFERTVYPKSPWRESKRNLRRGEGMRGAQGERLSTTTREDISQVQNSTGEGRTLEGDDRRGGKYPLFHPEDLLPRARKHL